MKVAVRYTPGYKIGRIPIDKLEHIWTGQFTTSYDGWLGPSKVVPKVLDGILPPVNSYWQSKLSVPDVPLTMGDLIKFGKVNWYQRLWRKVKP